MGRTYLWKSRLNVDYRLKPVGSWCVSYGLEVLTLTLISIGRFSTIGLESDLQTRLIHENLSVWN